MSFVEVYHADIATISGGKEFREVLYWSLDNGLVKLLSEFGNINLGGYVVCTPTRARLSY